MARDDGPNGVDDASTEFNFDGIRAPETASERRYRSQEGWSCDSVESMRGIVNGRRKNVPVPVNESDDDTRTLC